MLLTEQLLSVNLHASLQYELACVGCRKGFGARQMAAILDKLMRSLGYPKYFCQGEVSFQQLPIQLSSCRSTLLHHVLGTSMPSSGGLSKPSHDCDCPRTLYLQSWGSSVCTADASIPVAIPVQHMQAWSLLRGSPFCRWRLGRHNRVHHGCQGKLKAIRESWH